MGYGAFTHYIDIAQVALYGFWVFFAGLIYYLRREDKREGYPLESERSGNIRVQGFPAVPPPKTFRLRDGKTYQAPPGREDRRAIKSSAVASYPGAPLGPSGNPMQDGIGPASYVERENVPDLTAEGEDKIVPLRVAAGFSVAKEDPDPRGMEVIAADGKLGGTVRELWIDRSEPQIRYLEVAAASGGRNVLLPINFARINGRRRQVTVRSINAAQFAAVPGTQRSDQITLREEDQISGYFAGGYLYADPRRLEPLI
ncbi:MAG: photosynthetic reaction center subunit H [Proteobacteria bacterium]|nr:photosynthetic reaction center subunit H [Pseudomonadota bacterium]